MKWIYSDLESRYHVLLVFSLKVKVEYLGHIKNIIESRREENVEVKEGSSIKDLLAVLTGKYGKSFKEAVYEAGSGDLKPNFIATVNGYLLNQLNGIETKLNDGDHVVLMPIVSGG